jgi:hypothetical protein
MTEPRKIILCDDNSRRVEMWADSIRTWMPEPEWKVTTFTGSALVDVIGALAGRERGSRSGDVPLPAEAGVLDTFDEAEIVLLDSDLQPDPTEVSNTADGRAIQDALRNQRGDVIARQVRSFTSAKFIVVVNMFWRRHAKARTFDLTMQQGADTFADLHIREGEIGDEALWFWCGGDGAGFNPWSRPVLAGAPAMVDRSIAAVDLKAEVLTTLQLEPFVDELDPSQFDVFGDADIATATFDDLVEYSPLGFMYPNATHDEAARKRVAAAIVRNWLARSVVSAQDVIADAPHLVARFPQFLGAGIDDPAQWNAVANKAAMTATEALPAASTTELIALRPFLDRPVFSVAAARSLVPRLERTKPAPDLVFAENASVFTPRDAALEFASEVAGTDPRRHVVDLPGVDAANEPFRRLLL